MEYFPPYGYKPVSLVLISLQFIFRAWHRYLDVVLGQCPDAKR